MQTMCNGKDFLDCAGPRELIESLQKKVRKGQVSGTGSLFVPTLWSSSRSAAGRSASRLTALRAMVR